MSWRIRVPATTSNLGPGFDCFGMAVSLHLEVEVKPAASFRLTAEGAEVPLDASNLVAATMLEELGRPAKSPELHVHLKNAIPLARGLGSSASARVAGLALAELWRKRSVQIDRERIARGASVLEGHPDNAMAAVHGGFCLSAAAGWERVEMSAREHLLLIPEIEIHTEAARQALPRQVSLEDAVFNLQHAALGMARLVRLRDLSALAPFADRLHQRHRLALDVRLQRAFERLTKEPSLEAVFLSGSGPTLFALMKDAKRAAEAARGVCQEAGLAVEARVVRADNVGLQVLDA